MVSRAALSLLSPFSILIPFWPQGRDELAAVNSGAALPSVSDAPRLAAALGPSPGADGSRCEGVPRLCLLAALLAAHEQVPRSNTSLLLESLHVSAGHRALCVCVGVAAVRRTRG